MSATTDAAGDNERTGPRTDVTDADGFREELIRLAEDRDAGDWDMVEDRASQLLSDIRRTRPYEDDDDDDDGGEKSGDGDE